MIFLLLLSILISTCTYDETFRKIYAEKYADKLRSNEQYFMLQLQIKQKMVAAIYMLLYKEAQKRITVEGSREQRIIFEHQLTPEELAEILA